MYSLVDINRHKMDTSQLELLGFTEKEAEVYLVLNQIGSAPASTIARMTRIKRTSVYDILNSLLEKGLITSLQQGKYTYFAIDDVKKIALRQREQLSLAENVVDQLKAESERGSNVAVTYYRGVEGYREIYDLILRKAPKEILAWVNLDNFHSALDMEYEEDWTLLRVKQKMHARLLIQDTDYAKQFKLHDPKSYRETRLVSSKNNPFEATAFIYEDNVTLFHAGKQITGININHPEIYQLQKSIFELAWQLSS